MDEEVILVTVVSAWYTDLLISIFGKVYNANYFLDNFFFNLRIVGRSNNSRISLFGQNAEIFFSCGYKKFGDTS
jgi:hypothetical protein